MIARNWLVCALLAYAASCSHAFWLTDSSLFLPQVDNAQAASGVSQAAPLDVAKHTKTNTNSSEQTKDQVS